MKGVSEIIVFIIMVAIIFSIAAAMNPWIMRTITGEGEDLSGDLDTHITCSNVQYAILPDYGTEGIVFSPCTEPKHISAKIKNFGSENIYGFSFLLVFGDSEVEIPVTQDTQKTESNPLRPQEEAIIEGTPTLCTEFPDEIRITNSLGCPPAVY